MNAGNLYVIPLEHWIQLAVEWMAINAYTIFSVIKWPIRALLNFIQQTMLSIPFPFVIVVMTLIAWRVSGWGVAIFTALSLLLIAFLGIWQDAMVSLALISTAIVVCIVIGIPTGILCARSDYAWKVIRPTLDVMQTTPSFVYLVPVVMLFGIGTVPGAIAVIVAAMPPLIRLTNLGIRLVDHEMIDAGNAFGATQRQLLWEVQLPLALPTIMGGINQTVLMAMSMSVIIAMIGAEGLGIVVLQGLGRMDVGRAAVGGIAIVLLAIMLDRITQSLAVPNQPHLKNIATSAWERWRRTLFGGKIDEGAPQNWEDTQAVKRI